MSVGFESAVNKTNVAADSSMKAKSSPEATPELQKKPGWCWSELGGGWYKTRETLDKEKTARLNSINEEDSSTISPEEEARIRAEVREIMQKKFAVGRSKLKSNPIAHNETIVKSGTANSDTNVIDLRTQSVASLQKSQPAVLPGSPISLASTSDNTGNATRFSHVSSGPHLLTPTSNFCVNALETKGTTVFLWA